MFMRKFVVIILLSFISLVSYGQIEGYYYDVEYDRIASRNLPDFSGIGYGKTQEEATDNALRDLSIKMGVEVFVSSSYSYLNGEKTVTNQTRVTAGLVIPRGMVETEVERQKRKLYRVDVVLKVKEYILDCERRIVNTDIYLDNAQSRGLCTPDEYTSLCYNLLKYHRSILDTPIYWAFDREDTRIRLENINRQITYFEKYADTPLVPGVILDSSLEVVMVDLLLELDSVLFDYFGI